MQTAKLIVGLGNPGKKYDNTRHNAGFMFIDHCLNAGNPSDIEEITKFVHSQVFFDRKRGIYFLKPQTFMNLSGKSVQEVSSYFKIDTENIYVAYDDLDIELGKYKYNQGKSPREHNGVNSVKQSLGSDQFHHIRIGVDNRTSENRIKGEDYVLMKMTESEKDLIDESIQDAFQQILTTP